MRYTAAAVAVLQLSAVVGTVWSFQLHHQQPCINGRRRRHYQLLSSQALYATDAATDDVPTATPVSSSTSAFDDMLEKFAAPLEFKETTSTTAAATDKVNDNAVSITGADDTASSTLSDKLTAAKAAASKVMQQADEHLAATTQQTKAVETQQQKVEDKEQVVDENMIQIDNKKDEAAVTKTVAQETKAVPQPIAEKKEQKEQTTPDSSQQQQQEEEATTTLPTPTIETKTPFGPIVVPRRGFSDFGSPERKEPKIKMDFGDDEMTKMKPTALGVNPNRKKMDVVKMDKDDEQPPKSSTVTQEQKSAPKIEAPTVTKASESKAQAAAPPPESNAKESVKSVVTDEKASSVINLAPSATDMAPSSTATPDLIKTQPLSPTLTMPTLPESLRNVNLDDPGIITGGVVLLGVTLYFALVQNMNRTDNKEEGGAEDETKNLLQKVKDAGVAGAISYACWELAFWGISIPVCIVGYNKFTGHWPDLSNADDLKQLGAEIFAFTNVARLAVPLRIGLALSTTPWIDANIVQKFQRNDDQEEVDANGLQEQTFVEGSDFGDMVMGNEEEPRWSDDDEFQHEEMMLYDEGKEDFSQWSHVEERLSNIEEAVQVASGLGPMQVGDNSNYEERMASLPGSGYLNYIDEFCEPGTRSSNCAGAIKGYLDGLASTGAVASNREVNTIVGYLDSLSSNPMPSGTSRTGAAFTSYLDALSSGTAPSPPSAEAVAGYLDDLTNTDTRAADIESRLNKLESSISTLPDDIAYRIVGWQESQDKKMSEELEKIKKMLEGVKS